MTEITVYVEEKKKERKMHLPCHIAMKTNANNIFLILNISSVFPSPLWKGQKLKKDSKNQ